MTKTERTSPLRSDLHKAFGASQFSSIIAKWRIKLTMKAATILSIVAATSALLTGNNTYSKVDGLRFNIDGVTKCPYCN
jgi:hypothetical protein